ncbi:MAG: nodulation protein NfeD [Thermodesulfovibrio sp.]|uniref:NfeD family protein n=1 Tax=unclassified Thermodesulfovibrio TaxID=2645936 RepID=UPI00083A9B96|nr:MULTISPECIES: nodulation protein NfeD [unclassified Thermodesulfovibrio]MDI1471014.1 nodulation protein NfeD [Thermodesulfovibrio sp. 1176]MDI6713864.1 nodulation protein NfeD [Thermodesulfovibrio sp.]ODA43422.1 putative membrane-bound ClpP-class protease [Thermodesulfovibrio sp. N1]
MDVKKFLIIILFSLFFSCTVWAKEVIVLTVDGVINPPHSEYVIKGIKKAHELKAEALIIQLDTPGGLDTSMRDIVKEILNSNIPVVVYVSPKGARAASAGAFITLSAHVAAMAPGTNIGAAHPVAIGEKMDKTIAEKITNDAVAYIKSIAEQRGRNVEWAEQAVRKSISSTEKEALQKGVIDLIADDLNALIKAIHGKKVKTVLGEKIINTKDAKVNEIKMNFRERLLNFLSNPNIAYILLMIGIYGIIFELSNPGAIFPGVIGAISLILAFYSLQTLPLNYAAAGLILLGIILFILELKFASYGLLTLGGVVCVLLGSLMLFDTANPLFKLSLSVIIPVTAITALFFGFLLRLAYKAHKRKPVTGIEELIGLRGIAKTDIDSHKGMVMVHGELWQAVSDEEIKKDEEVVVEDVKGLTLKVRRIS